MPTSEGVFPKVGGDPPYASEYNNMKYNNHISGITPSFTGSTTAGWFLAPTGSTQASDESLNTSLNVGSIWAKFDEWDRASGGIIFDMTNNAMHYNGGFRYNFSTQGNANTYIVRVLASGAYDSGWIQIFSQSHTATTAGSITRSFSCGSISNFRYIQFMPEIECGGTNSGSMSFTLVETWLV